MKRLNSLLRDEVYQSYLKKISITEQDRLFCKHDWSHFANVARITYILVLESQLSADLVEQLRLAGVEEVKEIAYTAAFLHDIGRWLEYQEGCDHAQASAELSEDLLFKYGYSQLEVKVITSAITEHRGEASSDKSILGRLLCKADDLSRECQDCSAREKCKKIKNKKFKY
ncbi:HD domain-containing protein [Fuchsiella alkaliacetigena]|uniref:HD domain-containing protein n=1 Tax=Fuchsiella alkaliacetigena TaxID=957042 RepID=UPI00200AA575|nr:HD domain-containing protein [Fuchsiella alkaliacetigena]MCK8825264.1 HD domain-containing protein [Fuchsiella alkaliacetigena]